MISRLNRRKIKSIGFYLLAWFLASASFLFFRFYGVSHLPAPIETLIPAALQFAILTGLAHGIYEVYMLDDDRFHRSLLESIILRSLYNLSLVITNALIVLLIWRDALLGSMLEESTASHLEILRDSTDAWIFLIYAFICGYLITFVRSVNKKFGVRVFINTLLGKRQDPHEEERIFIFLDLRSATTLAEEIGHFAYSSFLRDYFRLVSNCCVENRGEVYQYAGDGVILTWTMQSCRSKPRPLIFLQDLVDCFNATRTRFDRKYKAVPQFKAAVHVGKVIATEVGNFGSSMAYHGDALNTTARLQSLCNLLKKDFLATETFVRKMPNLIGFDIRPQGSFQLRGKNQDLDVFSVQWNSNR